MSVNPSSISERGEEVLKTEVAIENYKIIAEWIRFADAKSAASLTVNGVLMGLLIPTLRAYLIDKSIIHPTVWWETLVIGLFLAWLTLLVISAVNSFLCILPFRGLGRKLALEHTSHFHPAAISKRYRLTDVEGYLKDCSEIGMLALKSEVFTAILLDAHLSSAKYGYVTRSIWCLAASVVFGFFYLLAIQF